MSSQQNTSPYRIGNDALWSKAWQIPLSIAGMGLLLLLITADASRIGYSYLFALMAIWTLVFGAIFSVLVEYLAGSHWGVSSRRILEAVMSGAPLAAILSLPFVIAVATGKATLYDEWMHAHHTQAASHAQAGETVTQGVVLAQERSPLPKSVLAGEDEAHTPQEVELHHAVLAKKSGYLNTKGWLFRAISYLFIWCGLALAYFSWSRRQDASKDPALTVKAQNWSAISLIIFALTLTFAAFDWLMALEPSWYSTIFGVIIFASSAIFILAFRILISLSFYQRGLVGNAINPQHFHDMAKLMFGFICFWTYTQFSQWMLIWYAGIPEEATWFHKRWQDGWAAISLLLIFGHFVAPFVLLISRVQKLALGWLRVMCFWVIAMHLMDIYWFVLPQAGALQFHPADFAALMLLGGTFLGYVFWRFTTLPIIPIGDPRLQRSFHHHQTH